MAGGKVSISVFRDKLRLVWSWNKKRYFLHTGLSDNNVNRMICETKAKAIELDCATGSFDASLRKYKGAAESDAKIVAVDLFNTFIESKKNKVYPRTLEKYYATKSAIETHFKKRTATSITNRDAEHFKKWLGDSLAPLTLKERIGLLKACWDWAIEQQMLTENPWSEVKVRVPPQPRPKPLTREEAAKILNTFKESRYYAYYLDYVRFLLGTGARTGEVIGLLWKHVSDDCSQVWIGESLSRGNRKEAKNNRARTITLPPELQKMLQKRKKGRTNDLVFPAPKGGAIDDHDFRNRAWLKCLETAGVEYRKPYITRSTFISHALASGMNPTDVAGLTGHEVETLYKEYAGSIASTPKVPSINWME